MPRQSLALQTHYSQELATSERLTRLVRDHLPFVWRALRRLGLEEAQADDAAQSVLLLLARRLDEVETGKERAFLFGAALRVAHGTRRRAARRRSRLEDRDLEGLEDPRPSPEALLERRRARALLDELLAELPLELRSVLVLHEIEELSVNEIAEVVGIPVGTAASRLRRARVDFERRARRLEARLRFSGELQ